MVNHKKAKPSTEPVKIGGSKGVHYLRVTYLTTKLVKRAADEH